MSSQFWWLVFKTAEGEDGTSSSSLGWHLLRGASSKSCQSSFLDVFIAVTLNGCSQTAQVDTTPAHAATVSFIIIYIPTSQRVSPEFVICHAYRKVKWLVLLVLPCASAKEVVANPNLAVCLSACWQRTPKTTNLRRSKGKLGGQLFNGPRTAWTFLKHFAFQPITPEPDELEQYMDIK